MKRQQRRRQKSRSNGGKAKFVWAGFCLSSLLIMLLIVPSAAYNVTEFDRENGVDVATDENALVGLQKASSIEEGQASQMVTVVNNFRKTNIQATVELTPPSRSEGKLVVNGTDQGDDYQFSLQPGGTQDISACFSADETGVPDNATFNATFNARDTTVTGNIDQRNVSIVNGETESVKC